MKSNNRTIILTCAPRFFVLFLTMSFAELTRQLLRRPLQPTRFLRGASSPSFNSYTCPQCRTFTSTPQLLSGHSKWSTIKHDKAKNDKAKAKQRTLASQQISFASKLSGSDPKTNTKLATAIAVGKRAGMSKASIETAVLRGQGKSMSGQALEPVTIEAMLPGNVAAVIECLTDSKKRTLQDVRTVVAKGGGNAASSVLYLFDKRGEVTFSTGPAEGESDRQAALDPAEVEEKYMDAAIEAGALDIGVDVESSDDGHPRFKLYTEPTEAKDVGDAFTAATGLSIETLEIVWVPKQETMATVTEKNMADIDAVVQSIKEEGSVQDVYLNIE